MQQSKIKKTDPEKKYRRVLAAGEKGANAVLYDLRKPRTLLLP